MITVHLYEVLFTHEVFIILLTKTCSAQLQVPFDVLANFAVEL